ncbi:probable endochitinase [Anopheles albimanus]|uniref:Chitin-binding type-2 domain-containing protein n=1 Tax=Anopheles albimanus TaxID=7167 RepID=A0A182FTV3_ANOAL|nr:probable endochitinase [Anopheles albimanus]
MQRFIVLAVLIAAANAQFCSRPGQIVPNPINCKEFFMCRTGRLILFSCPDNTLFNPRTMACDTTNRVRCELGDIPNNILTSAIKANPSKIEHTVTACINQPIASLLADHLDCSRFYQCSVTGSIGFQCPTGTLFDTRQRTCVERDLAVCGTVALPNPPLVPSLPIQPPVLPVLPPSLPVLPPSLPSIPQPQPPNNQNSLQMLCRGKPLGATVRNPLNCKQFVNCIGSNQLRLTTCPNGTAFDDVRKVCDWAQNVKC